MQVILLMDVEKVGLRGEVVDVARGYARNYLVPRRLAEPASPARVAELQKRAAQRARQEAGTFEQARDLAALLERTELRFEVKAGPTGSLFGSVTPTDLADEIWRVAKVRVDRRKIGLGDPIKKIGRYEVPVELFTDVTVDVKTLVVPEGGELPPEEDEPVAEEPVAEADEPVVEEPVAEADEPVVEEPVAEADEPVVEEPVAEATEEPLVDEPVPDQGAPT
jgi:large subunit ribosomal protein L9